LARFRAILISWIQWLKRVIAVLAALYFRFFSPLLPAPLQISLLADCRFRWRTTSKSLVYGRPLNIKKL
jgi:hypothetical protein